MGRRVLRRHIWGYSDCLCSIKKTPGLSGLSEHTCISLISSIKVVEWPPFWKKLFTRLAVRIFVVGLFTLICKLSISVSRAAIRF